MLQPFYMSADFKQKKTIREPIVTQYDDLVFVVTVFDNGDPAVLDGLSYKFVSRRPDNKSYYVDGVKTGDNEITFDLGKSEVSLIGKVNAAIQLFDVDNRRLSSFTFNYTVTEDISLSEELSSQERTLLEIVVQEGPALVDYFTQAKPLVEQFTDYVDDLNRKADLSYVIQQIDTIGNASPKGVYSTLAALQTAFPSGTTGVYVVSSDGKWYYWNGSSWTVGGTYQSTEIADSSITPTKTSFLKGVSLNLFDKTKVTEGYVDRTTGGVVTDTRYWTTDFIPCAGGTTYVSNGNRDTAYYDVNKSVVSPGSNNLTTFTVPSTAKFFRTTIDKANLDSFMIAKDVLPSTYRPFEYADSIVIRDSKFKELLDSNTEEYLFNNPISADKINGHTEIPQVADGNLFDKTKITYSKYIKADGTEAATSSTVYCTDFILIEPDTNYTFYKTLTNPGAWYDENKIFISKLPVASGTPISVSSPSNARYFRWNGDATADPAQVMIVEGVVYPSTYIPYVAPNKKYSLDWLYVKPNDNIIPVSNVTKWLNKNLIMFGDSIVWYDGHYFPDGSLAVGYLTNMNEEIGFMSTLNKGVSGASIAVDSASYVDVVTTVQTITNFSSYDLCLIAAGTNDLFNNVPIGTIGSINDTSFDTSTFYGAYRKIIEYIQNLKPTIQIGLFTPLQRNASGFNIETVNTQGHKLSDYADAIKNIGKMYAIPVLDLYSVSGVNKKTLGSYTIDGLHLNNTGYEYVTKNKIVPFLNTI